jgi:D-inositol-3-phosphate glycosyltransferase
MISFIWSPGNRLPSGTGGSENYTVGQVRELNRRGIRAQIVTVGLGEDDGRGEFYGIPFLALSSLSAVSALDGTVIFVNEAHQVHTRNPAYLILHNPPPIRERFRAFAIDGTRQLGLIATSQFAARLWADFLDVDVKTIAVVYPFAEPEFGLAHRRPGPRDVTRVLYAGRLSPEKGIYTLLEMLHLDVVSHQVNLTFTATTAGADKEQGAIIERILHGHPGISVVGSRTSPERMATLMAAHDVVIMPSNSQYWHETFGIVAVEAQHAGCRVVASDDGGLPEADCGTLILVEPDNAEALAQGILRAVALGEVGSRERAVARQSYTVAQSGSALVEILSRPFPTTPSAVIRELEELIELN